ncbi:sulfite oxidase [Lignipirellula cremea]|uniref:Sulfoxide reductase catalytic subunit YedY n=1 Tax=Lignipirellula cremea TaxID=2528010 RepID=A0A518DMC8_9BACT|nr:sulfite oxidase [Lignipirellula cremea]QDU92996.1 Sulfoxide reductase catalytic subunit YedY precursor [Lignipirellula cremea]
MTQQPNRRQAFQTGASVAAALFAWAAIPQWAMAADADTGELVPFLDMPRTPPNRLDWEALNEWLTPQDQVFSVQHYGIPEVNAQEYKLEIDGLVEKPMRLSIEDLKTRPQEEVLMTLECSGNGAGKGFINAIYNSRWKGTPLAPLLKECGVKKEAIEAVFFGADTKEEILRPMTKSELKVEVPFGRSLSVEDALNKGAILAYERNGEPMETRNGAPLRLIVPGLYGIANVKWLQRIELRDRRYMGRYMARDYVTVRGEMQGDEVVFVESSVAKMNLKSIIARVTRGDTVDGGIPCQAMGAAWDDGTGVAQVEVKVDDGPWKKAVLAEEPRSKYCWTFFSIDLGNLAPGEHEIVSRAIDVDGRVQPAEGDDEIALKKTYWEAYQQWPRKINLEA